MGKRILETAIPSKVADRVACNEIRIKLREDHTTQEFKLESLYYEVMVGSFDAQEFKLESLYYEVMVGSFDVNGNFEPIRDEDLAYKIPAINGGKPYAGRRVKVLPEQLPAAVRTVLEETLPELVERDWIRRNNLVEKTAEVMNQ